MDAKGYNKMNVNLKKINYAYITFVILWLPINLAFFNIDGKGTIATIITVLVLMINTLFDINFYKRYFFTSPFYFWLIWIVYNGVNLMIKGFNSEISLISYVINTLFIPYFSMVLSNKEIQRNKTDFLNLMFIILLLFSLLSITVLREGEVTTSDAKLDIQRVTGKLGNLGPLISMFILFFLSLLYVKSKKKITTLIIFTVYVIGLISISGTRKAFGAVILILIFTYLAKIKFSFTNIFNTILLCLVIFFGYDYVMDNTAIGLRFNQGVDDGEKFNTSNIEVLNYLGDRANFYIDGWRIFSQNPLSGIGLENYTNVSNSKYRLHTEYIVQLAETGLIGTLLFLLFNIGIGRRIYMIWRKYKKNRAEAMVLLGGFLAVLFLNLTAWTYSFPHYFIVFGVIVGFYENIKRTELKNKLIFHE